MPVYKKRINFAENIIVTMPEEKECKSEIEGESRIKVFFKRKRKCLILICCLFIGVLSVLWSIFGISFSSKNENIFIYIDNDDTIDSVYTKLNNSANPKRMSTFKMLSSVFSYKDHVHSGRYEITPSASVLTVFRNLRGGKQTPVKIVIPTTWTKEMALGRVAEKLMMDSTTLVNAFNSKNLCAKYKLDTCTIVTILIPNTYDIYWDITPEKFMDRMFEESTKFWNDERVQKANRIKLNKVEVLTLASIVDAETANKEEKPMIAGLYINRLHSCMPLQSDPTVKYALGDFELRRIYSNMLHISSPYNTYKNVGLPPSPIRIPTVEGIDAVLNYTKHNYLYMCAKEDLSGTHNFATSYNEHKQNAKKYTNAIDARKIK